MYLERGHSCDVLVIGGGIAGIMAAIQAAQTGCRVTLAASGGLFSGSSFYPGTWGLGLIGPENPADQADLAQTIQTVGCGMANPALVETFVAGIAPAIQRLRDWGVTLRRAQNAGQKDFIPCFDHKHRDWNGIEFASAREMLSQTIQQLGIQVLEGWKLLALVQPGSRVQGAVALFRGELCFTGCRALVLATGGYGGLFRFHLCTGDITGQGQALALKAGASLVNMEFMQMMPGFLSPAFGTIFNEKTFRYTCLHRADGSPLLPEGEGTQELLEQRSTHGPFTSRLDSRQVDLALFHAFQADENGVRVTYSPKLRQDPPEFIQTYFQWLEEEKGLTPDTPFRVGIFAHAANGGIAIDSQAFTGVPGLYACGEVTGGMHGADRIGGLSTANGLVFGGIAGRAAGASCQDAPPPPDRCTFAGTGIPHSEHGTARLQERMFQAAMVVREEAGLRQALDTVEELQETAEAGSAANPVALAAGCQLASQLTTAQCILTAALLRRESRGSHFRADFPREDPEQASPIQVSGPDRCKARFVPYETRLKQKEELA